MAPKRQFLPLLLLLSLSAFFLYSHYHSSLHLYLSSHSLNPNPHLNLPSNLNPPLNSIPSPSNFSFILKVLTFDRLSSLSRCLRSLAAAHYGRDTVHLHIYVDHFPHADNVGKSELLLDQKLDESRRILEFIDGFDWKFGQKVMHYRTGNVGLQAQWLEAWWPSSDHEFAFVVEDDLEVSPLYYKFLKALIQNYYYNSSNFSPSIYGASLQRPRFVPGKHGNKIQLDDETHIFLYQLVGTWGQLLFPKPWKEFRLWYDIHKAKGIKPFLQGMVTTGWYKKMGERIWTPWFISFIHSRGYFNIYTNFLHERALSVSHRDAGVNYGKTAGPDSYLLDESSLDIDLLEMQPLTKLKWYDFCFKEVHPGTVVRSFEELGSVLHSVQKQDTIILVSLFGASERVLRNLLCHFESFNIQNYIFMGLNSDFLLDLARRGHPVIDVDQFLSSVRAHKMKSLQDSDMEVKKYILVKAYVIQKCLESGYNSWVVDGNMLFLRSTPFLDVIDATYDFHAGKTPEILFIRSSSSARKIWVDDFIHKVALMVDSVLGKGRGRIPTTEGKKFVYIVGELFKQEGMRVKWVDEGSLGLEIDSRNANQTSQGNRKKMVFWSPEIGSDMIQKRLEELGLWIIDTDSSCTAVVCHQS